MIKGQLPLIECPQTDPEKKKKRAMNCLQDILLEQMDKQKITLAEIQRGTGIPWGTLMGWHDGDTKAQILEKNVWELARFLGVSIEYLAFGIGPEDETDQDAILKASG